MNLALALQAHFILDSVSRLGKKTLHILIDESDHGGGIYDGVGDNIGTRTVEFSPRTVYTDWSMETS